MGPPDLLIAGIREPPLRVRRDDGPADGVKLDDVFTGLAGKESVPDQSTRSEMPIPAAFEAEAVAHAHEMGSEARFALALGVVVVLGQLVLPHVLSFGLPGGLPGVV